MVSPSLPSLPVDRSSARPAIDSARRQISSRRATSRSSRDAVRTQREWKRRRGRSARATRTPRAQRRARRRRSTRPRRDRARWRRHGAATELARGRESSADRGGESRDVVAAERGDERTPAPVEFRDARGDVLRAAATRDAVRGGHERGRRRGMSGAE